MQFVGEVAGDQGEEREEEVVVECLAARGVGGEGGILDCGVLQTILLACVHMYTRRSCTHTEVVRTPVLVDSAGGGAARGVWIYSKEASDTGCCSSIDILESYPQHKTLYHQSTGNAIRREV